jgi:HSP20 family molecular chaperone IbpA
MGTSGSRDTPAGKFMEPATECTEENNRICLVVNLPGVSEMKIRIELDNQFLIISASNGDKEYRKEITLPWNARIVRKKFRDGVLELILERIHS